jgi:hypothetical protein
MRHYGFFANGVRTVKLPLCRRVLEQAPLRTADVSSVSDTAKPVSPLPPRSDVCPACHVGRMQVQEVWFPQRAAGDISRPLLICDTS